MGVVVAAALGVAAAPTSATVVKALAPLPPKYRMPWTAGETWTVTKGAHPTRAFDIKAPAGSNREVRAVAAGTASLQCSDAFVGQAIVALNVAGSVFRYAHLSLAAVKAAGVTTGGVGVKQGQVLGKLDPSPPGAPDDCGSSVSPPGFVYLTFELPKLPISVDGVTFPGCALCKPSPAVLRSTNQPPAPAGYLRCATESHTCHVPGVRDVVYGVYPRFRPVSYGRIGAIACINTTFGDPAPGFVKSCFVRAGTWYSVVNRNSGKCVDVRNGATANGTPIQQFSCNGTFSQAFQFEYVGGGVFETHYRNSPGRGWDVTNRSTISGASIQLWAGAGTPNQLWNFVYEGSGYYHFRPRSNFALCLDVPNGALGDSVQLQQATCNGRTAQSFRLAPGA
jgi:hypothetical protein